MLRVLAALLASLVVAACASVRSNVAVTHALPAAASKTVAIVPYTENLATAPDYQANTAKLAAQLRAKGYTIVPAQGGAAPDYLAFFMYRIDNGTPVSVFASTALPYTGSIITYGYRPGFGPSQRVIYKRSVTVDIVDRSRFQASQPATYVSARVYAGSVTSDGACSMLATVIDPMLMALFADFPGRSGRLQTLDIPADTACGPNRFG